LRTILCIPGTWADRAEFLNACTRAGLAAAGAFMVDTLRGIHVEFEHRDRDDRMTEAFASASGGEVEGDELEAITNHKSVVYLIGGEGDLDKLRSLVELATRLLPLGGLGIKVDSAGVAAPIGRWLALSVKFDPFGLIRCFVVVATGENDAYSCGMHNLGFPDVNVDGVPIAEAKKTIDQFNLYQVIEHPTLRDGQTFAVERGARGYRLKKIEDTRWPADDPFHNPSGLWDLVPL
jgi:hypothetical protein